jgi:multiple antibiotic resistance protein
MEKSWYEFVALSVGTWLPILNPFGILPQFAAYTQGLSRGDISHIARRATTVAAILLAICTILGSLVLKAFGISLPAFRLAGGIILFMIALEMLRGNQLRFRTSKEEQEETFHKQKEEIAVFPLAIPLIAGPGTITTAFILGDHANGPVEHAIVLSTLLAGMLFMYVCLRSADHILGIIGNIGKNAVTRVMGIVLAAVAAQFVIDAVMQVARAVAAQH